MEDLVAKLFLFRRGQGLYFGGDVKQGDVIGREPKDATRGIPMQEVKEDACSFYRK